MPHYNNYSIFSTSLKHFINKQPLYEYYPNQYMDLFKYSPLFPVFMTPFYFCGQYVGAILWNIVNGMVLYYGVSVQKLTETQKTSCLLIIFPEVMHNAAWFQSNSLLVGLALFSFYLIENKKLFICNFVFSFLFILKIYGFFLVYQFLFLTKKENTKNIFYLIFFMIIFILICSSISGLDYLKNQTGALIEILKTDRLDLGRSIMMYFDHYFRFKGEYYSIQIMGLILIIALYIRFLFKKITYENKIDLLILSLVFLVVFNHKSEPQSLIIASVGIGLYLVIHCQGKILKNWVFWMKFICSIFIHGHCDALVYHLFFIYFYFSLWTDTLYKTQSISQPASSSDLEPCQG